MNKELTYHVKTFGCQMNKSDSERVRSVMEAASFKFTQKDKADVFIVIACSVRQTAIDRIWGLVGKIKNKKLKIKNTNEKLKDNSPLVIITGCLLPAEKKQFFKKVDLIIDITNIQQLPGEINKLIKKADLKVGDLGNKQQATNSRQHELIKEFGNFPEGDICKCRFQENFQISLQLNNKLINKRIELKNNSYFCVQPTYSSPFTAYVPIMTGCDNYCAYCVVPYTRGREYSRPIAEILEEVNKLIVQGYKEIILLGQNVNSYQGWLNPEYQIPNIEKIFNTKYPISNIIDFSTLLRIINSVPGNFWIRFVTSHPKDLSDDLIEAMVSSEKVTEYLHLPAQSGDNEILEKMNRGYTVEQYKNLISKIRKSFANICKPIGVSTDIIVGFPGETQDQFENSVKLFEDIKYAMAYVAQYSPRPGTAAAKLNDNVSREKKKRREKILTVILEKTALENNQKLINQTVDVLVENCKNKICRGKTRTFKNVKFSGNSNLVGKFVKIRITEVNSWGLRGVLQKISNCS